MDTFGLRIIASDKVFFNGRCKKLTIPAPDGEKGVLAHHENMVIAVVVGIARMESTEGEVTEIAVGTGVHVPFVLWHDARRYGGTPGRY